MDLDKIVKALSSVPGVSAIALGGSQSRMQADSNFDYDIGLYYDTGNLNLTALGDGLQSLDDNHRDQLLNPPGAWGPWINGGAWITVAGTPVDILLRDVRRVTEVLQDCLAGKITIDYQCGHPFGFVNTIYAAETHFCAKLWQDAAAPLDALKNLLYSEGPYPPMMRRALIQKFFWEAWFSLACGRKAALKGDIHYAVGSAFRAVGAWVEVLFALNGVYLMNEKGSLRSLSALTQKPPAMEERVGEAYRAFAGNAPEAGYEILDLLHQEISALIEEVEPLPNTIR